MRPDDGIKIGDWVTCYYAGYWQVVDIKRNLTNSHFSDTLAIVRKGFTPAMKFALSLKFCDIRWCKKIGESERVKIENYFQEDPAKKREFDGYDGPLCGIAKGWAVDCTAEEAEDFNEKLRALPRYFSLRKFNRLAEEIGLRRHLFSSSKNARYLLTIVTYPWLADEQNNSPLYFLEKGICAKPRTK